jgi:hypothetical protein
VRNAVRRTAAAVAAVVGMVLTGGMLTITLPAVAHAEDCVEKAENKPAGHLASPINGGWFETTAACGGTIKVKSLSKSAANAKVQVCYRDDNSGDEHQRPGDKCGEFTTLVKDKWLTVAEGVKPGTKYRFEVRSVNNNDDSVRGADAPYVRKG